MDNQKTYHHGQLRAKLITEMALLVEERGTDNVSLLDTARRCGVSSAAPYRHFADKNDLLSAVAELGFIGLNLALLDAAERYPLGSRERVVELGIAYVEYLVEKSPFYSLMWSEWRNGDDDFLTLRALSPGYRALHAALTAWGLKECDVPPEPGRACETLLCLAHGIAVLAIGRKIEIRGEDRGFLGTLNYSVNLLLDGLSSKRPVGLTTAS